MSPVPKLRSTVMGEYSSQDLGTGLTGKNQQAGPSAVSPGTRAGDLLTLIDEFLVHTPAADPSSSFQRNQPCPLCGVS